MPQTREGKTLSAARDSTNRSRTTPRPPKAELVADPLAMEQPDTKKTKRNEKAAYRRRKYRRGKSGKKQAPAAEEAEPPLPPQPHETVAPSAIQRAEEAAREEAERMGGLAEIKRKHGIPIGFLTKRGRARGRTRGRGRRRTRGARSKRHMRGGTRRRKTGRKTGRRKTGRKQ